MDIVFGSDVDVLFGCGFIESSEGGGISDCGSDIPGAGGYASVTIGASSVSLHTESGTYINACAIASASAGAGAVVSYACLPGSGDIVVSVDVVFDRSFPVGSDGYFGESIPPDCLDSGPRNLSAYLIYTNDTDFVGHALIEGSCSEKAVNVEFDPVTACYRFNGVQTTPATGGAFAPVVRSFRFRDVEFDLSGDGRFNAADAEAAVALAATDPAALAVAIPALDTDGDGDVDLAEAEVVQDLLDLCFDAGIAGDLNNDGFVDCADKALLGPNPGDSVDFLNEPGYVVQADVDLDGDVDVFDWHALQPLFFSRADLNRDGLLNFFDSNLFFSYFGAGDLRADFAAPFGQLNIQDIFAFQNTFGEGPCD